MMLEKALESEGFSLSLPTGVVGRRVDEGESLVPAVEERAGEEKEESRLDYLVAGMVRGLAMPTCEMMRILESAMRGNPKAGKVYLHRMGRVAGPILGAKILLRNCGIDAWGGVPVGRDNEIYVHQEELPEALRILEDEGFAVTNPRRDY